MRLFLFITVLLSMGAASPGCPFSLAGRCFTQSQVNNMKIIRGSGSAAQNSNLTEGMTQTGYVVPADTQLRILSISHESSLTAGGFYYSDDDIGHGTATVGTNPVYMFNDGTAAQFVAVRSTGGPIEYITDLVVPTGKYPNWNGEGGANWSVTIIGIEEPN